MEQTVHTPPERRLTSIKDAAKILSVSTRTVVNLLDRSALESVYIGRRRLVTMQSIDRVACSGAKAA